MALCNCERCGNLFNSEHMETICPACSMAEQADLRKVTSYLREHPLANVMEVHDKTGVDQALIFRFVKAGSLKITNAPRNKCRLCGRAVESGNLCARCAARLQGGPK